MQADSPKETVIWNISMSGNSYFIVDLWKMRKISPDVPAETLGEITAKRIVLSGCTIMEMSFSNIGKPKVLEYALVDFHEPSMEFKFELRIKSETGPIVVRAVHAVEFAPEPILPV